MKNNNSDLLETDNDEYSYGHNINSNILNDLCCDCTNYSPENCAICYKYIKK